MKNKILILGGNGKLGRSVVNFCKKKDLQYLSPVRGELDLEDTKLLESYLDTHSPNYIINCASHSNVQYCEENAARTININYYLVKFIADYSKKANFIFITFSSDYVFDGLANVKDSYSESDIKSPISMYGIQKKMADEYLEENGKKFFILRFSSLFGAGIDNITTKILLVFLGESQGKISYKLANDEFVSPALDLDIISIIETIICHSGQIDFGTYNISSGESSSRFDFVKNLKNSFVKYLGIKHVNFDSYSLQLSPCSRKEFKFYQFRPINSTLNTSKIELCVPGFERIREINRLSYFDDLANLNKTVSIK